VTRLIKISKKTVVVNKNVAKRRKWAKFGDCTGLPPGPEENVTYTSLELIKLDLRPRKRTQEADNPDISKPGLVQCRFCGETGHWTVKCPKRGQIVPQGMNKDSLPAPASSAPSGTGASSSGKYVPPSKGKFGKDNSDAREEATLRVTNLSEDTTEGDLSELFRRFGNTSRIYLAKDQLTRKSRGFAFINYTDRADAQSAIDKLNGHGYDNLILQVEWAKPREDKPREGGQQGGDREKREGGGDRRERGDRGGDRRYGGGGDRGGDRRGGGRGGGGFSGERGYGGERGFSGSRFSSGGGGGSGGSSSGAPRALDRLKP